MVVAGKDSGRTEIAMLRDAADYLQSRIGAVQVSDTTGDAMKY